MLVFCCCVRLCLQIVLLSSHKLVSQLKIPLEAFKMSRKGLMEQDLSKLDVTKLHPLSPEVISRQATINIGNIFSHFVI